MCEVEAYLVRGGRAQLILENVNIVASEREEVFIHDIYGRQYRMTARIQEINLNLRRILFVEDFTVEIHA